MGKNPKKFQRILFFKIPIAKNFKELNLPKKKSVKRIPRNLEKCEKILEISKNPRNPINLEIIDVNLKIFAKLIKKNNWELHNDK